MSTTRRKPFDEYTPEELVKKARDNHVWLNAFSCIRPTDEFLIDVGRTILAKLADEREMGDGFGISPMIILTVNKS